MKLLLYLMVFVAPMGANAFSFEFGGVMVSPFRLLFVLAILCTVALCALRKKSFVIYTRPTRYSVSFMLIWLLAAILSVIWAIDVENFVKVIFFLFIGAFLNLLLLNHFSTVKETVAVIRVFTMGVLLQALIGWYEIFTKDYRFLNMTAQNVAHYINGPTRIPVAMCSNPNDFATLMFLGVFTALVCVGAAKRLIAKLLYLALSVNFALLLLITTSRANLLGLAIGLVFLLVVWRKPHWLILGGALAVLAALFVPSITAYVREILDFDFKATVGSDSTRMNLIKNGLIFLKDTLGVGVGAGQIESWMKTKAIYNTHGILNMHNWWVECLTSFGVLVFAGYIVFYVRLYLTFWRSAKKKGMTALASPLCAAMVGFVLASISSSSNMANEWLWLFWAICVLAQSALGKEKELPALKEDAPCQE